MNCSLIGKLIKEYRERLGISQEELCGDFCAVSTLSRLENGKHLPGRKQIEAFFSYMGTKPPINIIPMTEDDFRLYNLELDITNRIAEHNYKYEELLEEYKNLFDENDILSKQYYLRAKAIFEFENSDKKNPEKYLNELISVLQLTVKDFSLEKEITERYYTNNELELINSIAIIEWQCKKEESAIKHLEFLVSYYKNKRFIDERNKGQTLPILLYNLSNWYGRRKEIEKSLESSKEGIKLCKKYTQLCVLPELVFNLGCNYSFLGNHTEGKKCIIAALTIMKLLDNKNFEMGIDYVNENFGYNLTSENI